jgi:hypothetical protein
MSKLILKYVRVVDNTSLESYLVQGDVYGVIEESTGDLFHYYKLDVNTPYREGLWVNKERVEGVNGKIKTGKVSALPPMLKQNIGTVQRIICIPDESGHIVDLQRVQYISPLENECYSVTLVSGWEMKLTDKLYSRERLIGLWMGLQNKQA